MQGIQTITAESPKKHWNLLVDEIKRGLEATQEMEVAGPSSNGSTSPTNTASHSTPSYVMPPPVNDVRICKDGWTNRADYRLSIGPGDVTNSHCRVIVEHPQNLLNHPQNLLNHPQNLLSHPQNLLSHPHNMLQNPQYTNLVLTNGDVSSNFLCPVTSPPVKVTSQCPMRKVENPSKRLSQRMQARAASLNNVNYNAWNSRTHYRDEGGCSHASTLADRRFYVRESLVTSPHTVCDVVGEKTIGLERRKRRKRRRTASSRIRRKTQLHGRSAAYRIARRNAIRSRRRKEEIIMTKRTYYDPKPTFSSDLVTDNFFLAIFAILCFLPLGVASMCYTFAVRRYLARNERDKAYLSSLKARKLADTGVMFGITGLATAIVVFVVKANLPYAAVEYDYYLPEYT